MNLSFDQETFFDVVWNVSEFDLGDPKSLNIIFDNNSYITFLIG